MGQRHRPNVSAQQYIFLALALLLLAAWLLFRDSCARRLGETFGAPTPTEPLDGGVDGSPRRRPPPSDPDDW